MNLPKTGSILRRLLIIIPVVVGLTLVSLFMPAQHLSIEGIGILSFETTITLSVGYEVAHASPDVVTNSPTANTGAAWTNPANAYADDTSYATITSGAPSGSNVWGNYGFNLTGNTIDQVRVRYDAWSTSTAVTLRAAGTGARAASGNVTPSLPSGSAANDILICLIASRDNVNSTMDAAWTALDTGTNNGTGLRTTLFWTRYNGSSLTRLVTHASGSYIQAIIIGYYGCVTSGSPFDVNQSVYVKTPASTTNNFGNGMTTTIDNDKIVLLSGLSGNSSSATYTGSPTPTERADYGTTSYPRLIIADFNKTPAGATGARTSTITSYLNNGYQLSLKPNIGDEQIRVDVSWDGGSSWSSQQVTATTPTEATYWYDVTLATSWTPEKLANGQLQVRADAYTVNSASTVNLDWLPVEVNYTTGAEPSIVVNPTFYAFGAVAESSTPYTTTTYFTIDNSSTIQTDQTISVTTSTWSGGSGWAHNDSGSPGANAAALLANRGGTWGTGDIIVKYSSPNYIYENCPANTDYYFGLKLLAPTSFSDSVEKQIIVQITAVAG